MTGPALRPVGSATSSPTFSALSHSGAAVRPGRVDGFERAEDAQVAQFLDLRRRTPPGAAPSDLANDTRPGNADVAEKRRDARAGRDAWRGRSSVCSRFESLNGSVS